MLINGWKKANSLTDNQQQRNDNGNQNNKYQGNCTDAIGILGTCKEMGVVSGLGGAWLEEERRGEIMPNT